MLVCTTSCDDGVQLDLACDGCGEVVVAGPAQRRDAQALHNAARSQGWVVAAGPDVHHCARCASRPVLSAERAGDGR